jgi:hypothetical protein
MISSKRPSRLIQLALDDHDQAKLTRKRDHTWMANLRSGSKATSLMDGRKRKDKRAWPKTGRVPKY